MIEKKEIPTEIEEALRIARITRDSVLSGQSTLEIHLKGFFTVAQILGRTKDLEWIECELNGYEDKSLPTYRQTVYGIPLVDEKQLPLNQITKQLEQFEIPTGIPKIKNLVSSSEGNGVIFLASDNQKAKLTKLLGLTGVHLFQFKILNSEFAKLIGSVEFELIKKLNFMISEVAYGKIPEGIFKKFQTKVNDKLSASNPEAISELNIAYESLGKSEDPERIVHVAFACRRLVKAIADKLFPAKNGKYLLKSGKEVEIGEEQFLSRLEAYVDSIDSPNRKYIIREISLLRDLCNEIPESMNKGVHLYITNSNAERLVLYSYMILGDIIMEEEMKKASN